MAVNRKQIIDNKNDLRGADLRYANLQGANLWAANLRYANLQGANLQGANLQDANLRYANLRYANLQGANLQDANLQDADLQDASLWGAKNIYLLQLQDPRGFSFAHAINTDNGWHIRAGCRNYSINEAKKHWGDGYGKDRWIGDLYLTAIAQFERWLESSKEEVIC